MLVESHWRAEKILQSIEHPRSWREYKPLNRIGEQRKFFGPLKILDPGESTNRYLNK